MTVIKGGMTNEERLQKTIRLQKTDKILSGPIIQQFAASYAGISQKDYLDPEKAEKAYERTFYELGKWDIVASPIMFVAAGGGLALKQLLPGRDLPDNMAPQIREEEIMLPEDYDFVIQNGFNALQKSLVQRTNPDQKSEKERDRIAAESDKRAKAVREKWRARGVTFLGGGGVGMHPFEFFSFHRSLAKFSLDLRRTPDKVKRAIKACMPEMITNAKKGVEKTGCRRVTFTNARGSSTFINAKQFEELVLPSWLEFVYAMADTDVDVIFHCDTDWTRFLPYFKEFPIGRCVLQLDGTTDIFKAKEILRDHMALHGDVPATILTLGTPEQVTAYCKKIIQVIGEGGGFILSSGCSTPYDAKIENVRAMIKAGNELTWY
jgi:hypothetical protein